MRAKTVNIIGIGKVGSALTKAIHEARQYQLQGVFNRSPMKAKHLIEELGTGKAYSTIKELPQADITFITVADDIIQNLAEKLMTSQSLTQGAVVAHCSGLHSHQVLSCLQSQGAHVASIHPMQSFNQGKDTSLGQTYCALEGQETACLVLKDLFTSLGATCINLSDAKKTFYHLGGVFASNYLIGLIQCAQQCLIQAGIEEELALDIILKLMQGTLVNLFTNKDCKQSLSGPIERGDINTIKTHLNSLSDKNLNKIYRLMGKQILPLTSHNNEIKATLQQLLSN